MVGHQRMSFLDAFQGYHQIALAPEDQEKTSFITPEDNYHYIVMPFGLKNVGATYQQMVTMSFLDAFQGYHKIALAPEDQEKTSFITPEDNYHYTVMPFGLKNVGAMYQRMVTRMFKEQISETVEVYISDMVVKSRRNEKHVPNLV